MKTIKSRPQILHNIIALDSDLFAKLKAMKKIEEIETIFKLFI